MNIKLGNIISSIRGIRGISQAELSRRTSISRSYLNHIEKDNRTPTLEVLSNMADELQIPLSVLVFLGSEKIKIDGLCESDIETLSFSLEEIIKRAIPLQPELDL